MVAVPLLVALTDRVPARNVYLVGAGLTALSHLGFAFVADGFWWGLVLRAAAGIGWAGAYMPGLKTIADTLEGNAQSRAVATHAAGVGAASASSFAIAGLIANMFGNQVAFLFGGICALIAIAIALSVMPNKPPAHARSANLRALLDFRPVFRDRAAMAWIAGYTFHTWEMAGLRAWGVTFLTLAAAEAGAPAWLPTPTAMFTLAGFVGIVVSVAGNEMSQRFGRKRIVTIAMIASAALAAGTGWIVGSSAVLAGVLVIAWLAFIFLDSSALTAGTVQAADPALRGATMGLHSMCGYAGGFIGPLGVGLALDIAEKNLVLRWGLGFGQLAVISVVGLIFVRRLG
ncbi:MULTISPECIES: MFS transporter [unclassified Bradyrhizobium]|uniref:MFS transporter n=1 Tax=unclassified Bradyrhizobium TaxID=2631580 RepID=UPI0028EB5CA5|nr:MULTISPECIES: MFS transporter [unclassified Bradyrhizobium]